MPRYKTPKDINKIKRYRYNIYLTEEEYYKVKEICLTKNIKISAFMRKLIKNVINF